ncbi:myb family transcription factor EFM-like [Iris pallida]|uniref:Myb family transcription factor EFM-like n=1 Tax=Iris pallida TaxID=29817 RepID=A0AAX6HVH6_IRIPA|nr:myb family transcription factor EFM-like [Iris pallida]
MAPPDLGLHLKLSTTKIIISNLSKDPSSSSSSDPQAKIYRLEQHINNLEEERRKIEVFKRELPLCMYILDDVIGAMKEEVEQCRREPMQEFMPMAVPVRGGGGVGKLEKEVGVKLEKDCKDKMNWMSSAQLWSNNYSENDNVTKISKILQESAVGESDRRSESPETKNKALGAFAPFRGSRKDDKAAAGVRSPDLSLVPIATGEDNQSSDSKPMASCHVSLQSCSPSQAQRKARRCWSPELHRRFVAALQQLGGAQVATPKQIRELMKVDGLTNDEVKSHLQKYRLHTRRMPAAGGQGSRPATMIGGLWAAPQESNSQSGSPQGPLQLAGSSLAVSVTAGDSGEDNNSKSESYSWK